MKRGLIRMLVTGGMVVFSLQNSGAALTAGTLAGWDFDDGDLVVDESFGVDAEAGIGRFDPAAADPVFTFANSPASGGGPSLRVTSSSVGSGASFSITNSTSESAFVDEVLLSFAGESEGGGILLVNTESMQPEAFWLEIADDIPISPTQTGIFDFFQETFEIAPGESFAVMLVSIESNSPIYIDSVSIAGRAIPEPGSALLVALAGCFAAVRRKRA